MADDEPLLIVYRTTVNSVENLERVLGLAQSQNQVVRYTDAMLPHPFDQTRTILEVELNIFKKNISDIVESLEKRLDKKPPVWIETFTNWGKTQAKRVISSSPTTLDELKKLIKAAPYERLHIRCAGTGHSWAPIFSDENDLLIYMKNLESKYQEGCRIRRNPVNMYEVDIMAGATTGDFKNFQLREGLHIPANVILDVVQMVSVVATGCHGVGKGEQTPSDYVVQMRIIDAKGDLITYKPDEHDLFKAIQANFGCFGVIYDMTIKVIDRVIVNVDNKYKRLQDVFYDNVQIKEIFDNTWSVEMFWFPFNSKTPFVAYDPNNDEVWIREITKSDANAVEQTGFFDLKNKKDWLSQKTLSFMSPVIANMPSLSPLFSRSAFGILKNIIYPTGPVSQELPNAVHFRKYIENAPVYDMEFAFDLVDYGLVKQITEVVVNKVLEHERIGKYPLNIALEMRMMGYSDALLCPGSIGNPKYHGSGRVLYVEILSVVNTDGWKQFCKDVAKEWMKLKGVPHLAKQWDFIPEIEDHIYKRMEGQIDKFKVQLYESNCDPEGMFLNKSIKKLLRIKHI